MMTRMGRNLGKKKRFIIFTSLSGRGLEPIPVYTWEMVRKPPGYC